MGKHKMKKRDKTDDHSETIEDGDTYSKGEEQNTDLSASSMQMESEKEVLSSKKSKKEKKDKEKYERSSSDKKFESNMSESGKGTEIETEAFKETFNIAVGQYEQTGSNIENDNSKHLAGKKSKSKKKRREENDHKMSDTSNIIQERNGSFTPSSKKRKRSELVSENSELIDTTVSFGESVNPVKHTEEMTADDGKVKKKKHKSKKNRKENDDSEVTAAVEDMQEYKLVKKKKKDKVKEHDACPKDSSNHFNLNCKHETNLHETGRIISSESLYSNGKVSSTEDKPVVGQWDTNAFEDDSKQNKFLRLLGGFKKGADKTFIHQKMLDQNRSTNNTSKSSFGSPIFAGTLAMNKDQQDKYKKTMESEYELAMSMHLNRGTGLGFQSPQPAKKFSIDTQASKSVKFDDSD